MDKVLPLQFLNLGGEMMYIIDQRLRAQEVFSERADKVRNDILSIMLNRRFIEEVFKPQAMYSWGSLRSVFERLAHGSIMRLNSASMDKLFDLMIMALKQQVVQSKHPKEVLQCTLNHLDALGQYATSEPVADLLHQTMSLFLQTYLDMPEGDLAEIRRGLLEFTQDFHTRVSIFLREGIQNSEGKFVVSTTGSVPNGTELPGLIRQYNEDGEVSSTSYFPNGGDYKNPDSSFCFSSSPCYRGTDLGINLYALRDGKSDQTLTNKPGEDLAEPNYISEETNTVELDLLAQLLKPSAPTQNLFRLNLFNEAECTGEEEEETGNKGDVTLLESRGTQNPDLQKVLKDFSIEDNKNEKEMDLLDLLDSADV